MKYKIKSTARYKKNYKAAQKRGLDVSLLNDVINKLANGDTLEAKYKDHALNGNYSDFRECHIKPDWLLVYMLEKDILILTLVGTGKHNEVFK